MIFFGCWGAGEGSHHEGCSPGLGADGEGHYGPTAALQRHEGKMCSGPTFQTGFKAFLVRNALPGRHRQKRTTALTVFPFHGCSLLGTWEGLGRRPVWVAERPGSQDKESLRAEIWQKARSLLPPVTWILFGTLGRGGS